MAFACAIIYGFQPFTLHVLKVTQTQNALLFTMFGAVGLLSQNLIVARVSKALGLKNTFTYSIMLVGVAFVMMFFSYALPFFIAASILMASANSHVQTLIPTILSQEAEPSAQGAIMGLNASYQSIGMIVGPILGGFVATLAIPYTFLTGAILVMFCYFLSFKVLRSSRKAQVEN
jgi:DHA1 family multidrug resistance protein-like MFS transporter